MFILGELFTLMAVENLWIQSACPRHHRGNHPRITGIHDFYDWLKCW
ncbi:hypothetical protein SPLC1_S270650 [Arthrospira platensis C1]|nr:hypothetical protein SPLC1_S270650 [Arthrospira platensis C1]